MKDTTGLPVDIIGINEIADGTDARMYAARPLTWLRDTPAVNMQSAWGALYRDVIILDPLNRKLAAFNLTSMDLGVAANYNTVKQFLTTAATITDTDGDKLPDYWEQWAFGDLSKSSNSLLPDERKVLQHFAHGSSAPLSGVIPGLPQCIALPGESDGTTIYVIWHGRRGVVPGFSMAPEFSVNPGAPWTASIDYTEFSRRPLYDGSGAERIEWRSVVASPIRFIRIKAALNP